MNRLEALVALNMVSDIGSVRLSRLLEFFATPQDIFKASRQKLLAAGIGEETAGKICALKKEELERELLLSKKYGLKIIIWQDKDYPENLQNIPGAPIVLYLKGELRPEDKSSLAIVGSRQASFYGLSCAEKFARGLADCGFTVVSGLARGIDTCAHRGALKNKGRTIAVLGSGFGHLYPRENKKLAEQISLSGAVLSEFPIGTEPMPYNFPRRNRIISGLSLGTLVVEAARNSGALITADFALEQGREVFALPGKLDSGTSFGTNGLIKQGAKLVTCLGDILEEFSLQITQESALIEQGLVPSAAENVLSDKEEINLYESISNQPVFLDEIAEKTKMDVSLISSLILRLQLKKLIRQLPGKQFVRA